MRPAPRVQPLTPNQIAARVLTGLGVGHLLVAVLAWATGGPGLLAMYGL